ncbi:hypothetical protein [Streptomyces sp. NPDC002573]|uniref:8-oxoguanine DNA glycosylase OGG fold protein n=1 Tax=Streptomyces sp. NPDC002573 TaxID=3364651 RepID=UPI0036776D84
MPTQPPDQEPALKFGIHPQISTCTPEESRRATPGPSSAQGEEIQRSPSRLGVRYGECVQKPVRFRPGTWRPRLASHRAAHVLDIGVESASGPGGDRLIERGDLARLRDHAGDDADGLRDLFVAVMIWGSGTTNGRGPQYTEAALSDPSPPDHARSGPRRRPE